MNRTSIEAIGLVLATLNLDDVYPAQRELLREVLKEAKKTGERVVFPTMLRKMWSGSEVQAWLDENVNKEKNA